MLDTRPGWPVTIRAGDDGALRADPAPFPDGPDDWFLYALGFGATDGGWVTPPLSDGERLDVLRRLAAASLEYGIDAALIMECERAGIPVRDG